MSYRDDLTPDLANWIAGLMREMLLSAPAPSQRNTEEWILEQLDEVGSAVRGGEPSLGDDAQVDLSSDQGSAASRAPSDDEPAEGEGA